jgi:hypothetical protein
VSRALTARVEVPAVELTVLVLDAVDVEDVVEELVAGGADPSMVDRVPTSPAK